MAAKTSSSQRTMAEGKGTAGGQGTEFAINKTRGLAFSRGGDNEEWQAVDLKDMASLAEMERVSHTKIGENWFSVYRASNGKR